MSNSESWHTIGENGDGPRFTDAGSGNVVFLLQARKSELADRLAEEFRVVTFDGGSAHDLSGLADALGRAAQQLGIAKFCLLAESEFASAAVAHAIEVGDSVEALILISPQVGASTESIDLPLEQINAPTLVLSGTRDRLVAPETGRVYARRIPKCFYTLVYDAGHDIEIDRPQALHEVVRDFLEHREKFVISHDRSAINP